MTGLRLDRIATMTKGKIVQGTPSMTFNTFNIDSRQTEQGDFFFAIIAQRNGHDFLPDAFKNGAKGAAISQDVISPSQEMALVKVHNTLTALQDLATHVLSEHEIQVVGVTGSNG